MKILVYRRRRIYRKCDDGPPTESGHEVIVVDNLSQGHLDAVPERRPVYQGRDY